LWWKKSGYCIKKYAPPAEKKPPEDELDKTLKCLLSVYWYNWEGGCQHLLFWAHKKIKTTLLGDQENFLRRSRQFFTEIKTTFCGDQDNFLEASCAGHFLAPKTPFWKPEICIFFGHFFFGKKTGLRKQKKNDL
jgi:hypothetical protein